MDDMDTVKILDSPVPKWYTLYTKSRHEKFIHNQLLKKGIESFLPLRRVKRRWSDRIKVIEEPLFKGYLFVKTDLYNKQEILMTKGVVKFVSFKGIPVPTEEAIINSLRILIENEAPLEPYPYLEVGDLVEVIRGPFEGTQGYIIRKSPHKCRLVISVPAIRSSVSLEIDADWVEKL